MLYRLKLVMGKNESERRVLLKTSLKLMQQKNRRKYLTAWSTEEWRTCTFIRVPSNKQQMKKISLTIAYERGFRCKTHMTCTTDRRSSSRSFESIEATVTTVSSFFWFSLFFAPKHSSFSGRTQCVCGPHFDHLLLLFFFFFFLFL